MVTAATIRPPPPPRDVSIDKTYRLLARLVHSGSSFGLGLRWYWKMSSDHPAFSFSGDCRRRQWCSLKQGQRFSLSKKTLAEVPQAVVVRPLIQLQLHAALGQFKKLLMDPRRQSSAPAHPTLSAKAPRREVLLGLPEPDHSVCANCALQMQPPGSLTPWALW